ncbi:MAG: RIP metalloprotease RseP [Bacteroidaceae bacterium]
MEIFLIRALQLILCFSLLVLLHEGGHFFFAKLFKVRVEKFCLFFDPWFTLFKFKPKKSDTEYGLGWLPLGGYVKIAGMIDESMDTEAMKKPEEPWEFRSKPAWQRLLIMVGGVVVNFLVALFIYSMILFTWGETYVPLQHMDKGMKFNETAQKLGFRDGDVLVCTDKDSLTRFDSNESIGQVYRSISQAKTVTVKRGSEKIVLAMPSDMNMLSMIKTTPPFVNVYQPSIIDSILPNTPAEKLGLKVGDRLINFNGLALTTWNEYNAAMIKIGEKLETATSADSLKLRKATIVVEHRATGQADTLSLTLMPDYKLGVMQNNVMANYVPRTIKYGFFESFPAGISHGCEVLSGYVSDMKYLFTKDGAKSMGSFGAIGSMFPTSWDWQRFWELTAFISIILAFMNILPIPALDGGHVFFLLFEVVTRRKPSDKFMERAQMVGMSLLFILMGWAVLNDVIHFLL